MVKKLTPEDLALLESDSASSRTRKGEKRKRKQREQELEIVDGGRYFAVIIDGEIASRASVDPIESQGGNIGVVTEAKYRKRGFGRAVVFAAANWCLENNIMPIYWVDVTNTTSVKLAEDLGFEKQADEVIVKHWPGDAYEKYQMKTEGV